MTHLITPFREEEEGVFDRRRKRELGEEEEEGLTRGVGRGTFDRRRKREFNDEGVVGRGGRRGM